jgi:hypothetical protein
MSRADIPDEIDFSGGKRGVYATRYAAGTNVIVLDPDVARRFKTSEQVNRVLRAFIDAASEITTPRRSANRIPPPTKVKRRITRG